ncbi:hypothetical protein HK105_207326 [Polyrhizophydium stewartii]|uniref:Rhodanese domain-containing protein n=1 Tax=Polyrhizophydium stewartii TaxID=2732419 RepID=A0ABR4N101_9FUNG
MEVDWFLEQVPEHIKLCVARHKPAGLPHSMSDNILFVFPRMPEFGVMHIKLMLLWYLRFLRVVITLANLMRCDWEELASVSLIGHAIGAAEFCNLMLMPDWLVRNALRSQNRQSGRTLPQTLFVKVLGDSRAQPIAVASGDAGSGRALRTVADLVDAAKAALPHLIGSIDASRITAHLDEQRARAGIRLRSDMLLRDLPHPRDTPLPGSTSDSPLVIRAPIAPKLVRGRNGKATFEFYHHCPEQSHFKTLELDLNCGRVNLYRLYKQLRVSRLYLLIGLGKSGFIIDNSCYNSLTSFEPNQTYRFLLLRPQGIRKITVTDDTLDRDTLLAEFGIDIVCDAWNLCAEVEQHWIQWQRPSLPGNMAQTLEEYLNFGFIEPATKRSVIVSAILQHVFLAARVGRDLLYFEEDVCLLFRIPRISSDRQVTWIHYDGKVDFAFGHTDSFACISKSIAVIVCVVKTQETFEMAHTRALEQAAAALSIRSHAYYNNRHSPTSVFFVVTDSQRWRFYQLFDEGTFLRCVASDVMELGMSTNSDGRQQIGIPSLKRLYSRLLCVVEKCWETSPDMAVVCCMYECKFVSGSALCMDGQLTVHNLDGGPCYRCIFPVPPPSETVTNCSEGGVLGVVPGIIGSIQALEVIKIIVGMPAAFSQKMLLLDAELGSFRTVRLRAKNADCAVCGINPSITAPIDYVQFCGASAHDKTPDLSLLEPHERISVEQLRQARDARTPHVLLDVRDKIQVDICALDGSLHIPLNKLDDEIGAITDRIRAAAPPGAPPESVPVYAICRRGNDSQLAVQKLKVRGIANALDVIGGLREWSRSIDPTFPSH